MAPWWLTRPSEMSFAREAEYVIARARSGEGRVVALVPVVFFSTASGDAWMLDPEDRSALCLARGGRQEFHIDEDDIGIAVRWNAHYRIVGKVFFTEDADGHSRRILGYPVRETASTIKRLRLAHGRCRPEE